MLIYTRKGSTTNRKLVDEKKPAIVNEEELKPVFKVEKKKKKSIPIAVEEPIVVEEKTEDEDLSQWLKEHTED